MDKFVEQLSYVMLHLSTHPIDQGSAAASGGVLLERGHSVAWEAVRFRGDALFGKELWSKPSGLIKLVAVPSSRFATGLACGVVLTARASRYGWERASDIATGLVFWVSFHYDEVAE